MIEAGTRPRSLIVNPVVASPGTDLCIAGDRLAAVRSLAWDRLFPRPGVKPGEWGTPLTMRGLLIIIVILVVVGLAFMFLRGRRGI
jgi:hypothetical protein